MIQVRPARSLAALVVVSVLGLSACSGDGGDGGGGDVPDGTDALAGAKKQLDDTSGVRLTLSTDDDPDAQEYLSKADGVITADPPAFEGTASGSFAGIPASDVGIVSVDGKVYVQVFGTYQDFDLPSCVPDPAGLLDPENGFATILTAAQEVGEGEQARGGQDNDEILTTYEAVVPGDAVKNLLPCAPGDEFDASFTIDDSGALRTADITGSFFPDSGDLTYSIAIDAYDVSETISAP